MKRTRTLMLALSLLTISAAPSKLTTLDVGDATKLNVAGANLESSDPKVAAVYANGFIVALKPGQAIVRAGTDVICRVKVIDGQERMVNPATLEQYPDNRKFKVGDRKCVGTVLNGHMVGNEQKPIVDRNRVLNPKPLRDDRPLEWELVEGTPVYDGAGALMGTAAPALKVGEKMIASSKFNYGFSKVIDGRLCLYGFNVDIRPDARVQALMDDQDRAKPIVSTSAWVPLDGVVEKESLLENVGMGKGKLPRLPLEPKRFRITGGNPNQYMTDKGELRIVDDPDGAPVPSHYLRRPTGTVNIIYCVPGFSMGGHSLDSFLISSNATFRPARGVRPFAQPTYYPAAHPKSDQKSENTMTFIYGAVEVKGSETVYGWIAKEALQADTH